MIVMIPKGCNFSKGIFTFKDLCDKVCTWEVNSKVKDKPDAYLWAIAPIWFFSAWLFYSFKGNFKNMKVNDVIETRVFHFIIWTEWDSGW